MTDTNYYYRSGSGYKFDYHYINNIINSKVIPKKEWERKEIEQLILSNDMFVVRSLLKLYSYQTEDEKLDKDSNELNGVGFNMYDANVLCDIAQQIIDRCFISIKQIHYVRKKIIKYAKQLTKIANNKLN